MVRERPRRRKSNRQLLIDRLYTSYVDRVRPFKAEKREASHLQSIAALFAAELDALSRGAGECRTHPDRVDGACPICRLIWSQPGTEDADEPQADPGDETMEQEP